MKAQTISEAELNQAYNTYLNQSSDWKAQYAPLVLIQTMEQWQATWDKVQLQPQMVQDVLLPSLQLSKNILIQEIYHFMKTIDTSTLRTEKSKREQDMERLRAMARTIRKDWNMEAPIQGYLSGLPNRFSAVKMIPRIQIMTQPETFQGRTGEAFSQSTVDKILREGYDKSQEPIAVFYDKQRDKYVVISGHSRWHASQLLFKQGDKSLAEMPVKVFQGSKAEAIDYALLESNRSGTEEGLKSDITAYKRAIDTGKKKDYLLSIFKTEAKIKALESLACLNPNGRFLEYLGEDAGKSFPYLERNSIWVGTLRRVYPQLTNSHESEIFNFLYSSEKNLTMRKEDFFNMIEKTVTRIGFIPDYALNLTNFIHESAITKEAKERQYDLEQHINQQLGVQGDLMKQLAKARMEGNKNREAKLEEELSLLKRAIIRWYGELDNLKLEIKRLDSNQLDIFSAAPQETEQDRLRRRAKEEMARLKRKGIIPTAGRAVVVVPVFAN